MAQSFNCPNCGAENQYSGEGDTVRCAYCGSNVRPPAEMVNQAAAARLNSRAKIWIVLFIVVVFVLPTCVGFGGTLIGVAAGILGAIVSFLASIIGFFFGR